MYLSFTVEELSKIAARVAVLAAMAFSAGPSTLPLGTESRTSSTFWESPASDRDGHPTDLRLAQAEIEGALRLLEALPAMHFQAVDDYLRVLSTITKWVQTGEVDFVAVLTQAGPALALARARLMDGAPTYTEWAVLADAADPAALDIDVPSRFVEEGEPASFATMPDIDSIIFSRGILG